MLAVSKRLTPASRHMSTCRVAPETSVWPTLSKGPLPPNVMVPRVNDETKRPERPRRRYSIYPPEDGTRARASVARRPQSGRGAPVLAILRPVPRLPENALVVFVSDSHIGGDPGCDGFESPEELRALFDELAGLERPVELILAGDFFDFLQIGAV